MVFLAPEKSICDEEITDFVTAEVEDECAPILMRALARIFVFVKSGSVVAGQGPIVAREMGRHPINDHADAGLMQAIDEEREVVGIAKTMGGRVEACYLITPGRIVGVFGDGQKFHVGE